ncbi:MAG: lipid-A-disaccharide synthase N-terminal domain-containing protein [Flavobacteriaceae bacterium]|nr:lipid-A-disaccharide synthase N-terminal domain-containing protein [Flavobacteriaceae bacterium]
MSDWIIYSIGFIAQILFSSRMIYQWVASEKAKRVVTPQFFWQLSLMASFLLFLYGFAPE